MEQKPTVYKRRSKRTSHVPLSGIKPQDDEFSGARSADFNHGVNRFFVGFGTLKHRLSWVDRPHSRKGRRSSITSTEVSTHSAIANKTVSLQTPPRIVKHKHERLDVIVSPTESTLGAKGEKRNQKSKVIGPPPEYVQEQRAMYAEIDAFELESEEESPASIRSQDCIESLSDATSTYTCLLLQRGALEIVPEDDGNESAIDQLQTCLETSCDLTSQIERKDSTSQSGYVEACSHGIKFESSVTEHDFLFVEKVLLPGHGLEKDFLNLNLFEELCSSIPEEPTPISTTTEGIIPWLPDPESLVSDSITTFQVGEDCQATICGQGLELSKFARQSQEEAVTTEAESKANQQAVTSCIESELVSTFYALLRECGQTQLLTLDAVISEFSALPDIVKLGEGTFGEAFKGGQCVFKIVPMEGHLMINGEAQKTSCEILSEVLLTKTLEKLRGWSCKGSIRPSNICTNFIESKAIQICKGCYSPDLIRAWEVWDLLHKSENDHPMLFPENQLYVVFVLADGGKDLESFVLSNFNEARSILIQLVFSLAVAEEVCGFEHRDLHWGNLVLLRDPDYVYCQGRLLGEDRKINTFGISLSIIDFTLSRLETGNQVLFYNLSADQALFEGPLRDVQAQTYRRMLKLTKGLWEEKFLQTNCHWIHYIATILLMKKSFPSSMTEKRGLRSFCRRVLHYGSAKEALSDTFFEDMWLL